VAALALLLAAPAVAHRAQCSPSAGTLAPRLLHPCDHAVVSVGKVFTFVVRDRNPLAHKYPPFLNLTNRPPRHGVLKNANGKVGIFIELHPVRGHADLFAARPPHYTFPGYWLVTRGTYYMQVQQVDCSVSSCHRYSPVERIQVR
jgi:hypothetical protein